jgi:dimethylamine/trimethylamine dehydrogenase
LDARKEVGGRVLFESALPGLNEWRRVIDWRVTQIDKMPNVSIYPSSPMTAEDILEAGRQDIILATGASYRRDGVGRALWKPVAGHDLENVFNPDDLMNGKLPTGNVVIYDDDHYYMSSVLTELLTANGCNVILVTPAPLISYWTKFTLEQERIHHKLIKLGVKLYTQTVLSEIKKDAVRLSNTISEDQVELPCDGVVLVTDKISNDAMYYELKSALEREKLNSLRLIGDAEAPNVIAQAVFSGHLAAREFDEKKVEGTPFKVERIKI